MALLTVAEKGRIWSSLDDNLREQIRTGQLTFEEAAKYVVPIGDLQLQRDREQYPTRAVQEEAVAPESGEEYGLGTMVDINIARGGQSIDAFGAEGDVATLEANRRAETAAGQSVGQTLTERLASRARAGADALSNPANLVNPFGLVAEGITGLAGAGVETAQDEIASRATTTATRAAVEQRAMANLTRNLEQINETTAYLKTLPQNPYSTGAINAVDNGDFLTFAKLAIPAVATTMGEQGLDMAASAAVAGTVYYATRNPKATAAAAKIAAGVGSSMEYGSDLASLWEEVPESERSYEKFKEVQGIARQAAGARALIDSALPGYGAQLGTTFTKKAVYELALQMSAGALGEEVATRSKTGQGDTFVSRFATGEGASAGELVLEALADSAGVITEAYPSLKRAAEQDRIDLEAERYVEQERNRAFAEELTSLERQKRADANRAVFDAEAEADRLIEGIKMQSAEQMEMPFGSGYGGNISPTNADGTPTGDAFEGGNPLEVVTGRRIPENDRVPTIVDMFSGESKAAPAVQRELDSRVPMDQMPEETDEAFEIRQQRTTNAKVKIEDRKQAQFEDQKLQEFVERQRAEEAEQAKFDRKKEEENSKRRQEAEDKTTLKNERSLLARADITREAKDLLAREQEGVRRQKKGIARTPEQMDAILKAYERKRLPELVESVQKRRLARVNEARERELARENESIKADNEKLAAEQAQKKFTTAPRTEANKARGIPSRMPGEQGYARRGTLTDLLPGNQLKAAQTYTAKGDVAEREAQDAFEADAQQRLDLPPRGTQATMDLPQGQEEQGSLFTGDGRAFRGTLTEKQRQQELEARVKARREDGGRKAKADEERAVAELTEREEAVAAEIPTVAKAIAQEQTKQANLTAKKYAKEEQDALKNIIKEELANAGNRTPDEVQSSVATKLAAWRKANPRPESVPAPGASLVEQARTVAKRQEGAKKAAETKATNKALAREIARGATPEEAAELVANQRLSNEAERELRQELGAPVKAAAIADDEDDSSPIMAGETGPEWLRQELDFILGSPFKGLYNLLERMTMGDELTTAERWLAQKLGRLAEMNNIRVVQDPKTANTAGWGGAFVKSENAVWFRDVTVENVLHESVHSVTTNIIEAEGALDNPRISEAVNELKEVLKQAKAEFNANKNSEFFKSRPALRALLEAPKGPLSSVSEFLAYGLSNRAVSGWLASVESAPKSGWKTLWHGFREFFQKLYKPKNPEQASLLDRVIAGTDSLLKEQDVDPSLNARGLREARKRTRSRFAPANDQTQTPAFKKWFGNSKVVDENGNPLRVYHGSRGVSRLTEFLPSRAFFTSEPSVANTYTKSTGLPQGGTLPVFLKIENPLIIEGKGRSWANLSDRNIPDGPNTTDGWVTWAKQNGHDGVIFRDIVDGGVGLAPPSDVFVTIEASQVKSAVGNSGNFDPNDADLAAVLNQDELEDTGFSNPRTREEFTNFGPLSIRPEWKNKKTIGGAIVDAFSSGAGGLKVSTEIFDRAQSDTAALIFRAEKLYGIIDSSLEAQAPQTKEGIEQYRQTFIEDITAFENETGRLQKAKSAWEIRKKYGAAGKAYFSMRRTIDSLSKDILRQRLEDPRPFTNAEAKIYRSIRDNVGKYYTRVYAANTKGLGEQRAKELKKAFNAVVEGSTDAQYQEGYETVRNAATFIRDNVLAIPDEATLQDMPLLRLNKLANAWGISPMTGADLDNPLVGEAYREALVEQLTTFANKSPQAKDARALKLVLEALNRTDSTVMNYYRGSKQDRTIVTERETVPQEIRKLLGEYEDIPLRAMITIARQAEFRARNRAFNELLAAEQGKRILTEDEYSEGSYDPDEWVPMKGPAYGALEGMRVRKDLAARIEDSAEVSRTFDQVWAMAENRPLEIMKKAAGEAVTGWAKFASAVKAVQLVWNVGNAAFNFLGGPIILMSNGNMSYKHTKRALGIAWDLINSARQSTQPTGDSQKVIRAGITDSAFMGEIRAVELEQLRQLTLEGFASETGQKANKFKQGIRGGKRMWREAYAMADVTWKIANFLAEEEKLNSFYKAEGIPKTDEQIEREAAWRTNLSNFSYKRVPNLLKVIEKGGLTYVMPYIYETMRANVGSISVGAHDLKLASAATTPEGRRIMQASGFKRITGSLMALGLMQYLTTQAIKMVAEKLGQTDDEMEEWVDELKAMLPEYKRFSDYVYMGRTEDGKPVLFELSRLDPFGPVTEFFRMGVQGASPEEMLQGLKGMWINNPYGSSIASAFFGSPGSSTRMERIQPGFAGGLTNTLAAGLDFVPFVDLASADAAARRTVKAIDAVFPSMPLNMFDPNNKNAEGDMAGWVMTNMMGVKVHNVDPAVSTQHAGLQFKADQTDVRNAFVNFLKTSTDLTDNEILERYTALQEQEQENFDKVQKQYEGLLDLDYTPEQAIKMLKVAGLSENDLAVVYSGGYRPQHSGIVNFANLERSFKDTVELPNVPAAKKKAYLENISTLFGLVESGQIPARSE